MSYEWDETKFYLYRSPAETGIWTLSKIFYEYIPKKVNPFMPVFSLTEVLGFIGTCQLMTDEEMVSPFSLFLHPQIQLTIPDT